MVEINIEIENADKIVRAFDRAPQIVGRRLHEGMKKVGTFTSGKVKQHITQGTMMWKSPVDTGQMRQGIHPTFAPMSAIIRTSPITDYAYFVHEGTKFMRKRPFFDITAKVEEKAIGEFMNRSLDEAIKDLVR